MAVQHLNQVFYPENFSELFSIWERFPDSEIYAGGTSFLHGQGDRIFPLPANVLSLERLEELHRITRTERYVEIGAMVFIDEILRLGKIIPRILTETLRSIATPQIRNMATIGGNISHPSQRLDGSAAMTILDARYELRSAASTRWISAARFAPAGGKPAFNSREILTRVRIPLESWDFSLHKQLKPRRYADDEGGTIVLIARTQKNILAELRIVFSGKSIIRDKSNESTLSGKQLPLDRRDVKMFIDRWQGFMDSLDYPAGMLKDRVLNFVSSAVYGLAD